MSEGCHGGYAILHAFLAENGEMVSEDCAPYLGKEGKKKCRAYRHCPGIAKIKNTWALTNPSVERI